MQVLKVILPSIVTLAIGIMIGWRAIPSEPTESEIEWEYPGGSLKINAKTDLNSPEVMLKKLFSTKFSRAGTENWLQDNYQLFSINEEALVKALQDSCTPPSGMTKNERRKFLKRCSEKTVIKKLRALAESHDPPFHYIGVEVVVSIPDSMPEKGKAYVCLKNPRIPARFLGKKIQLTNTAKKRTITVEATGYYVCTGIPNYADIQLNLEDAKKLFPDQKRQEYDTTKVIAVILGG